MAWCQNFVCRDASPRRPRRVQLRNVGRELRDGA
jgi:hypothetical protein